MPESGLTPCMHLHSTSMHAHEYLEGRRQLPLPPERRRVVARPATPPPPTTMSISGEDMAEEEADEQEGVLVDLSCRSNECSCSIKWKFGDTSGFLARTREKASFRHSALVCMRYAKVTVTLLETPAKQCTNTAKPFVRASSVGWTRERERENGTVNQ